MGLKKCLQGKPVQNSHSKIDKTKSLMTNGSLVKVERQNAPLGDDNELGVAFYS